MVLQYPNPNAFSTCFSHWLAISRASSMLGSKLIRIIDEEVVVPKQLHLFFTSILPAPEKWWWWIVSQNTPPRLGCVHPQIMTMHKPWWSPEVWHWWLAGAKSQPTKGGTKHGESRTESSSRNTPVSVAVTWLLSSDWGYCYDSNTFMPPTYGLISPKITISGHGRNHAEPFHGVLLLWYFLVVTSHPHGHPHGQP